MPGAQASQQTNEIEISWVGWGCKDPDASHFQTHLSIFLFVPYIAVTPHFPLRVKGNSTVESDTGH